MKDLVDLTYTSEKGEEKWQVPRGTNLRTALLKAGYSPYASIAQKLNCGGHGLCATCGVWIIENEPQPKHWHDKAAKRYGYPRLSCQITVDRPMKVSYVKGKRIWGSRKRKKN